MATDAEIRAAGLYAVPNRQYLQDEFQLPTEEVEEETESFGIPNTNSFTNSGGNNYTGSYNFDNRNFNNAINNRQYNLNNPNKINQFVNKGLSFVGMEPQRSVDDMIKSRLTDERNSSGIPLGIGSMISKVLPDKYYDMNLADQAYTQSNMGYTGPTIFGENLGNQDPFGRNVRNAGLFSSIDGNYAKAQERDIAKLDNLFAGYTEPGYTGKYAGLSLEEDEDGNYSFTGGTKAQIDYANKMHKVNLSRYNFDKTGLRKYSQIQKDVLDQQMAKDKESGKKGMSDPNDKSRTGSLGRRPGSGGTVDRVTEGPGQNVSNVDNQAYDDGGREGFGYGLKDGGRAGYFFGGRVNYKAGGRIGFRGGGMDMGNEENQAQSAAMGNTTVSNNNDGGNDNPPNFFVKDKTSIIDTSGLKSKSPEININYTDPRNYASLKSKIYNKNILDNDDINVDGTLSGEFGPVSYNTDFTDQGITGTNLTAGNFNAKISPDMQLENLSYSKGPFSISSDGKNTKAGLTFSYKNGGLAGLL